MRKDFAVMLFYVCMITPWNVALQKNRIQMVFQVIWYAEATVDNNWELGDVLAVQHVLTPTCAGFLTLMGNTSRGPTGEQARMQKMWNILVMRSFLQKGDISLRSQHAYYSAPSSGFIKTRWKTLVFFIRAQRACWKYEEKVFSL